MKFGNSASFRRWQKKVCQRLRCFQTLYSVDLFRPDLSTTSPRALFSFFTFSPCRSRVGIQRWSHNLLGVREIRPGLRIYLERSRTWTAGRTGASPTTGVDHDTVDIDSEHGSSLSSSAPKESSMIPSRASQYMKNWFMRLFGTLEESWS